MTDSALLAARVRRALALTNELAAALSEEALGSDIPGVRSNAIGDQFWCIVGARESYLRAAAAGAWSGFSCSLDRAGSRSHRELVATLDTTAAAWESALSDGVDPTFAMDLLEHEVQHHGQFVRYVYALGLTFPAAFRERYALS